VHDGLDTKDSGEQSFTHSDHERHASILIILNDTLRYTLRI